LQVDRRGTDEAIREIVVVESKGVGRRLGEALPDRVFELGEKEKFAANNKKQRR